MDILDGGIEMKPYFRAQTIRLRELQDRRRVLTDKQKQEICERYAKGDIGTRPLARMYGCSRSLVCIIVNNERAQKTKDRVKAHWRDYAKKYGKASHATAIRNTRNYKYKLLKNGQLIESEDITNG